MINLEHSFIRHSTKELRLNLLKDVNTIDRFCSRVDKHSKEFSDPDKAKGDMLELLVECFIKLSPIDTEIGISNYKLTPKDATGVDGYGIGLNGNPATVQVKFRLYNYELTANEDHLANFITLSQNKYGVKVEDKFNMLIITTGKDVNYRTKEDVLCNKVRVINREKLKNKLDNNNFFWDMFRDAWEMAANKLTNKYELVQENIGED